MSRFIALFAIFLMATMMTAVAAFAPSSQTVRRAKFVSGARPATSKLVRQLVALQMSTDGGGGGGEEQDKQVIAESKISADGTFYDDELDSAPKKEGLSDSMRARLMAEASTGLDSDSKQTNVILYIIGVVGVLVVLGGAGIFY